MPFVYENVSDEDTKAVCWEQYEAYRHPWSVTPDRWTIDRQRNVFIWLIRPPVPDWPNQIFGFSWKGDASLRFEFISKTEEVRTPEGVVFNTLINVVNIEVPESLRLELDSIRSVLEEAIETYVRRLDAAKVRVVSFV